MAFKNLKAKAEGRCAERAGVDGGTVDKKVNFAVDRMVGGKLRKVEDVLLVAAFQSSI